MAKAEIDYGFGRAVIYGEFNLQTVEQFFFRHANQCFGIRKSIARFRLLSFDSQVIGPEPWASLPGAATILQHSGDTIVWDAKGEKIKSEWDE